jgi:hypothetical protein
MGIHLTCVAGHGLKVFIEFTILILVFLAQSLNPELSSFSTSAVAIFLDGPHEWHARLIIIRTEVKKKVCFIMNGIYKIRSSYI